MTIRQLRPESTPRIINPKAPLAEQVEVLTALINDPPENTRVITYCPALADYILHELNTRNRKAKEQRVKRYAEAMADDKWELTGDTIKFSKRRKLLLDGQNRLAGCVQAGVNFQTHTAFGIEDEAFDNIDSNKTRTNEDTLFVYGVPNSTLVSPAVRWITLHRRAAAGETPDDGPNRGKQLTNPEMLKTYLNDIDHDRVQEAAERVKAMPSIMFGKRGPHKMAALMRGSFTGLLYMFAEKNASVAKKFANDAIRNERGVKKLADYLAERRERSGGRLNEILHCASVIKCWNAYRRGESVTKAHVKWDGGIYPTIE